MDSVEIDEFVFVTVPLKNGKNISGLLQDLADSGGVLYGVVIIDIQALVGEDDGLVLGLFEIRLEPLDLLSGDIWVSPLEVFALIRSAVAAEAGIEDDEVKAACIKGIIGAFLTDDLEKFGFCQGIDAVVSPGRSVFGRVAWRIPTGLA